MADLTTAIAALIKVGKDSFAANTGDPTFGQMYEITRWADTWQPDTFNWPTVAIYRAGGTAFAQGLGTAKQWRYPILRVDIFARNYAEAEKSMEALRTFWIADRDYTPVNVAGVVGQGYLRVVGKIKWIEIGEARALAWEKSGVQFRRLADIRVEIGD